MELNKVYSLLSEGYFFKTRRWPKIAIQQVNRPKTTRDRKRWSYESFLRTNKENIKKLKLNYTNWQKMPTILASHKRKKLPKYNKRHRPITTLHFHLTILQSSNWLQYRSWGKRPSSEYNQKRNAFQPNCLCNRRRI